MIGLCNIGQGGLNHQVLHIRVVLQFHDVCSFCAMWGGSSIRLTKYLVPFFCTLSWRCGIYIVMYGPPLPHTINFFYYSPKVSICIFFYQIQKKSHKTPNHNTHVAALRIQVREPQCAGRYAVRPTLGAALFACSSGSPISSPCAFPLPLTGPVTPGEPDCCGCGIWRQARWQWLPRWWTIAAGASTAPLLDNSHPQAEAQTFSTDARIGRGGGGLPSMPGSYSSRGASVFACCASPLLYVDPLDHRVPAHLKIPGKFETQHAKDSTRCAWCTGLPQCVDRGSAFPAASGPHICQRVACSS